MLGAVVVSLLLAPRDALAQANYEGIQLGGRTAMMGGAAVVGGQDQATAFINPAGITRIPGQSFSFSTVTLDLNSRTIDSALDPSGSLQLSDPSSGELKLRIVPNTFCLFLDGPAEDELSRRSRHKYALCAATTEREEFSFTENRSDNLGADGRLNGIGHSTRMSFLRSTLASSWGLRLSRDTNIGVTARVGNTRLKDSTTATAYASSGGTGEAQMAQLARNAWSWDTSLVLGITSNISRVVTVGASLTTPSQHLFGEFVGMSSVASSFSKESLISQEDGDFRYNQPGSVRLGLAFTWPRFILEVDGSFYAPQAQLARASFGQVTSVLTASGEFSSQSQRNTIAEKGKAVTNLAVGMEYFMEPDFSVVAGLQTDFSGLHERQNSLPQEVLFRQSKDLYHASLGVSSYGERGRLLLGLRAQYGEGSILIADVSSRTPSLVALPQHEWGLSLVLSGRISFSNVRDTAVRAATPLTNLPDVWEESEDEDSEADPEEETR